MQCIVAKKMGMTQLFSEDGTVLPVTLLKVDSCAVTQVKTKEKDGYVAAQVGYSETKKSRTKAIVGHSKGAAKPFAKFMEFGLTEGETVQVGDAIDLSQLAIGDVVHVMGVSKGKGFQGVVKRHHFRGGPASHGHKDNLRMPGSIGSGGMQRVFKGLRMGGRMGGEQVTVKNLRIEAIDAANNTISVRGAVPGARGTVLVVKKAGSTKKLSWN